MELPIAGGSYQYFSPSFSDERSINLYPTFAEVPNTKTKPALQLTAGLSEFIQLPETSIKGSINADGNAYVVAGSSLYLLSTDGTYVNKGSLTGLTSDVVSIAYNGVQLFIAAGNASYVYTISSNAIYITGYPANTVCFVDGYFVFNEPNTGRYRWSALYDGTNINSLNFATAEGKPDSLMAVVSVHGQLVLLGASSTQFAYTAPDPNLPFQAIQGAFIEYGCAAAQTARTTANTVYWLGQDESGGGVIWQAEGYNPQKISTDAITTKIRENATDLTTAAAYTYQEDGHYFYCLNIEGLDTTLVYDINTKLWHEKAYWDTGLSLFERHKANNHIFAFDKHLVGAYDSGIIYEQALSFYSDNGDVIVRERTFPHLANNEDLSYIYYKRLFIDMQTGIGLDGSGIEADTLPQARLFFSDNSGFTWKGGAAASIGAIGGYGRRLVWNRLGRAITRTFRLQFVCKCKIFIVGGNVLVEKGY
jgi:hypothetical protein